MNEIKFVKGDSMKSNLKEFKEIYSGWKITFKVELNEEEASKCNIDKLSTVGDYEIKFQNNNLIFDCIFDKGELRKNETIEERLILIKKDIENLTQSSLD